MKELMLNIRVYQIALFFNKNVYALLTPDP